MRSYMYRNMWIICDKDHYHFDARRTIRVGSTQLDKRPIPKTLHAIDVARFIHERYQFTIACIYSKARSCSKHNNGFMTIAFKRTEDADELIKKGEIQLGESFHPVQRWDAGKVDTQRFYNSTKNSSGYETGCPNGTPRSAAGPVTQWGTSLGHSPGFHGSQRSVNVGSVGYPGEVFPPALSLTVPNNTGRTTPNPDHPTVNFIRPERDLLTNADSFLVQWNPGLFNGIELNRINDPCGYGYYQACIQRGLGDRGYGITSADINEFEHNQRLVLAAFQMFQSRPGSTIQDLWNEILPFLQF